MKLSPMMQRIEEARREFDLAMKAESVADPDYLDLAIEATNIAKSKLNNLYKLAKLEAN